MVERIYKRVDLPQPEGPNIERLHAFIAAEGAALSGRHHEIYLSDMRRTAPDKLKTLIRQPFVKS